MFGPVAAGVEVPVGLGVVVRGGVRDTVGGARADEQVDGHGRGVDALVGEGVVDVVDPVRRAACAAFVVASMG